MLQRYEDDLREWLREPEESIAAMQAAAQAQLSQVEREGLFDHILVSSAGCDLGLCCLRLACLHDVR